MFLIFQTVYSSRYLPGEYLTLTPNHRAELDIQGDAMPGIQGIHVLETDEMGFRVTKKVDYREKGDAFRVFVMGGSTAEQPYLDNRKTWTHLLQERLERRYSGSVEVINTGVSGTRSPHHLLTFRKAKKFQPDLAIFLLGANDWNWHISYENDAGRPFQEHLYYGLFGDTFFVKNLFLKHSLLGRLLTKMTRFRSIHKTKMEKRVEKGEYFTEQNDSLSRKEVRPFRPLEVSREYKKYLSLILKECRHAGITCLWMTQPSGYQKEASETFKKRFWMTPPNRGYTIDFASMVYTAKLYNEYLSQFASENLSPICDLAAKLPADESVFFDDMHFNESGAQKVSDIVYGCVEQLGGPRAIG